jgi:hypothetical protein
LLILLAMTIGLMLPRLVAERLGPGRGRSGQ